MAGVAGQPMVERVAQHALDDAGGLRARQPVLGLALELGLADEHRQHGGGGAEHVVGRHLRHALVAGQFAIAAQALGQRGAKARLVRAAVGRRHGVAIGAQEPVVAGDPGDRPLDRARAFGPLDPSGEHVVGDGLLAFDAIGEKVLEPAREMEDRALRRLAVALEQRLGARPADFDAAEQIGLRPRHAEQPRRLEGGALAENLGVGLEADLGAAPVLHRAETLHRAVGRAARIGLAIELLAARHLDFHGLRQRVGHRHADAVQAAAGLIDLGVELSAGMQRGHDDLERGLLLEFGVRIDRDAAAIIGHGEEAVGLELDLDARRLARHRLVHGVVEHLGEEMVHRLFVGAADIHAGAPAHRLEPLQHLDVGGGIGVLRAAARSGARSRLAGLDGLLFQLVLERGEQVA